MTKSIPHWQMSGFIFTSLLGTFLHFLFDLTGGSPVAALFSAVNESIWEHMKLLYYPMLIVSLIEYRAWGSQTPGFWCVKLTGTGLGLLLIPVLYYTYTGTLGVSADWFNIAIFFLAAGLSYFLETRRFRQERNCPLPARAALLLLAGIGILFTVLTFLPPHIPFFRDPVTGTYGFQ